MRRQPPLRPAQGRLSAFPPSAARPCQRFSASRNRAVQLSPADDRNQPRSLKPTVQIPPSSPAVCHRAPASRHSSPRLGRERRIHLPYTDSRRTLRRLPDGEPPERDRCRPAVDLPQTRRPVSIQSNRSPALLHRAASESGHSHFRGFRLSRRIMFW